MDPRSKQGPGLIVAAVIIPLLQAAVSGCAFGIIAFAGCLLIGEGQAGAVALFLGGLAFMAAWLILVDRFYDEIFPYRMRKNQPRTFRLEIAADQGRSLQIIDLPATSRQLNSLARGILNGSTLNESSWSGFGRPFTRAQFRQLRDELVRRGLAEWRSSAPSQGVQLTASGRAIMRKFAISKSPYPILGDHIPRGDI
jgi:hypothetical protein